MKYIDVKTSAGVFAENKDLAAKLRENIILPSLKKNEEVTIDFTNVDGVTQSFVHALISEAMREFGPNVLDNIMFKGCNKNVQEIVLMVTDYMQESL